METFQKVNRIVSNEKRRIQLQSLKNSPESSSSTSTSASTKKMKAVVFYDNALLKPRLMPKYQPFPTENSVFLRGNDNYEPEGDVLIRRLDG
jgi:hypothetical protein